MPQCPIAGDAIVCGTCSYTCRLQLVGVIKNDDDDDDDHFYGMWHVLITTTLAQRQ